MKKTRICDILHIEYPIFQGGMLWLADAGLAATVSNSGGLGVISPLAGSKPYSDAITNLGHQIDRAYELTSKPFGVNLTLDLRDVELLIDLIMTKEIKVVITAAGDPSLFTDLFHSIGTKIFHVVSSVKQALKAESAGVDGIIAEGVEAAARNGYDELPLFSLIPQVVDEVAIPVIAAGGIVDSRGMVAAMSLGAEGVQLGTRFVVTNECIANPRYKEAIIAASDTDTTITLRKLIPSRSLKTTPFTKKLLELEQSGATPEKLKKFLGHAASRTGGLEGDLENGEAYCGASAGLIKEILPVEEVMRQLINGYCSVVENLSE